MHNGTPNEEFLERGEQESEKHRWEQLGELVDSGTVDEVDQFLDSLPAGETARAVS